MMKITKTSIRMVTANRQNIHVLFLDRDTWIYLTGDRNGAGILARICYGRCLLPCQPSVRQLGNLPSIPPFVRCQQLNRERFERSRGANLQRSGCGSSDRECTTHWWWRSGSVWHPHVQHYVRWLFLVDWKMPVWGCAQPDNNVELTVTTQTFVCGCADSNSYVVRPAGGTINWGGVGYNGNDCASPTQAMTVVVETTDIDTDGDGIIDDNDNCLSAPNADQLDTDGDEEGDALRSRR
jgi:hypothetical protein